MENIVALLTSPGGTASRREFWIGGAILIGVNIVLNLVPLVGALARLALLYPWTCLSMARLNDMGHSPRLALLPLGFCAVAGLLGLITAIGMSNPALFASALMLAGVTLLVSSMAALVAIAFLLWLGLTPGATETAVRRPG
ncbi:hypothetical protein MZO42_08725 [Sphingomonas psychrotolerans]|uniref:DUF805 domain-containing protein n=1 Tax=Sphingomonas psychrotolerans TaxID=1327635 RepID=A0ABU3N3C5_9SPHN|nr:hypothetical protein [Sphingomonas psychrotolerans]MDT8758781.1 hypothetical protein [Sphingomonas psychrotolerans]